MSVCEKYLSQNLPLVRLDEKFIFYTQIVNDLERTRPYHDIKSIRINLQPLIKSIIDHAVEWRNTLGNILADRTRVQMVELNEHMQVSAKGREKGAGVGGRGVGVRKGSRLNAGG